MATFPSLTPSTRTFSPGDYPASAFTGLSGKQSRVRHSTAMLAGQLRLSFIGLSETNMLSILSHYQGQQGGYLSFDLPSSILSGFTASDFTLTGYSWRYAGSPQVEDFGDKLHTVTLTLETVPPEGAGVAGVSATVTVSQTSGAVTASASLSGISAALAASLERGLPSADLFEVASVDWPVLVAFQPGSATASSQASGFDLSVAVSIAAGTATAIPASDPDFSSVSFLLHMNGSNGSTTFTDSSGSPKTVTRYGSAEISTSQSKFGGASGYFNGSSSGLLVSGTSITPGTGDYTFECWIYPTANNGSIVNIDTANGDFFANTYLEFGTGNLNYVSKRDSVTITTSGGVLSLNTWSHVAVTRSAGTVRLFVNGAIVGSGTSSANLSANSISIGSFYSGYDPRLTGYMDEVRYTKGVARYTANFTPPTAEFPDS